MPPRHMLSDPAADMASTAAIVGPIHGAHPSPKIIPSTGAPHSPPVGRPWILRSPWHNALPPITTTPPPPTTPPPTPPPPPPSPPPPPPPPHPPPPPPPPPT